MCGLDPQLLFNMANHESVRFWEVSCLTRKGKGVLLEDFNEHHQCAVLMVCVWESFPRCVPSECCFGFAGVVEWV